SGRSPTVSRGVPGELLALHEALLRRDPAERPQTADEALRMLRGGGDLDEARRMLRRVCVSITGREATTVSMDALATMPGGPVDRGRRSDAGDTTPAGVFAPAVAATRTYPSSWHRRRDLR